MNLAVTEGLIKAASQAVKEEWQSFRADLLRDLTHLIHAEVAKVSLGSPAEKDVPGTLLWRSKTQEVETPEKLAKPVASLAACVNGENMDTVNPVLVMEEDFPCTPRRRHKAQDNDNTPEKLVKPSGCGSAEAAFVKDEEENQDASNSETQVEAALNPSSSLQERQQRRRRQAKIHSYRMDLDDEVSFDVSSSSSAIEEQFEASWLGSEAAATEGAPPKVCRTAFRSSSGHSLPDGRGLLCPWFAAGDLRDGWSWGVRPRPPHCAKPVAIPDRAGVAEVAPGFAVHQKSRGFNTARGGDGQHGQACVNCRFCLRRTHWTRSRAAEA
ncbi:unnamed protein product [Symbiodinium sp. CCMP2592]|nr:unnamed protein product [Symbiodinium sp. CCMP2592]